MLKKLGIVFIVLLIFIAAASTVYAGHDEKGNNGAPLNTTVNTPSGTSANTPAGTPANTPSNNSSQKDGGSQTGSNPAAKSTNPGETKTAAETADKGTAGGTEKVTEKKEDPEEAFWRAIRKVLKAGKPVDNGQFIVTITSPEKIDGNITTYDKCFDIAGVTEYTDVEILIAMLNNETGEYEIIDLPDGDKAIDASTGAFQTELELDLGECNLMLIAYRTSEKNPDKVQYNSISVTVYRSFWDKWVGNLFGVK